MTTKEVLIAARAKIAKPEQWIQGYYAKDADGKEANPFSTEATCYCVLGALIASVTDGFICSNAADAIRDQIDCPISTWNDDPSRTHAEVLAVFDRAIEAVEE